MTGGSDCGKTVEDSKHGFLAKLEVLKNFPWGGSSSSSSCGKPDLAWNFLSFFFFLPLKRLLSYSWTLLIFKENLCFKTIPRFRNRTVFKCHYFLDVILYQITQIEVPLPFKVICTQSNEDAKFNSQHSDWRAVFNFSPAKRSESSGKWFWHLEVFHASRLTEYVPDFPLSDWLPC